VADDRKELEALVAKLYASVKDYGAARESKGRVDAALKVATETGAHIKNVERFLAARDEAAADAAASLAEVYETTKKMLGVTARWATAAATARVRAQAY